MKNSRRSAERGAALLVALALIVIVTFLGFGLLSRSFLSSRIAGLERWPTKTFYAADSGISAAKARLRLGRTGAFDFPVGDFRGKKARPTGRPIEVQVSPLVSAGPPHPVTGNQVGGGQGSGCQALYLSFYRTTAEAQHPTTRSRRVVSAAFSLGPAPLSLGPK